MSIFAEHATHAGGAQWPVPEIAGPANRQSRKSSILEIAVSRTRQIPSDVAHSI